MVSVILYRYDGSPYSRKAARMLLLKNIPHKIVNVPRILPRPELSELLGISYRRIPILAIGNDVFCDTSLIASALERHFPASAGYNTLFPANKSSGSADGALETLVSKHVVDDVLFPLAVTLVPWDEFPKPFLEDRSKLRGKVIDPTAFLNTQGQALAALSSSMALFEQQLKDGRKWFFDTEAPGLADLSIHFILQWIQGMGPAQSLFDRAAIPHTLEWIIRLSTYLEELEAERKLEEQISGDQAAGIILSSNPVSFETIGFDVTQATQLGLELNQHVHVAPVDSGKDYPTTGRLVALSKEEIILEVQGKNGLLYCHFPKIGFSIVSSSGDK